MKPFWRYQDTHELIDEEGALADHAMLVGGVFYTRDQWNASKPGRTFEQLACIEWTVREIEVPL